ncbi:putative Retinal dehydrogenase 1-like [Homarus americanus]|uniref:Putative Retinal dehydrogenase 1-like n=1 Tax=Homarus americanus TaxID=6706 RepID=A0A8J5JCF3_HOMAM|nr:putative Retinal dehydrogenase 1-like [Homarus americanus]
MMLFQGCYDVCLPQTPFGGYKQSGHGRELCGRASRCKLETGMETDSTVGVRERLGADSDEDRRPRTKTPLDAPRRHSSIVDEDIAGRARKTPRNTGRIHSSTQKKTRVDIVSRLMFCASPV